VVCRAVAVVVDVVGDDAAGSDLMAFDVRGSRGDGSSVPGLVEWFECFKGREGQI